MRRRISIKWLGLAFSVIQTQFLLLVHLQVDGLCTQWLKKRLTCLQTFSYVHVPQLGTNCNVLHFQKIIKTKSIGAIGSRKELRNDVRGSLYLGWRRKVVFFFFQYEEKSKRSRSLSLLLFIFLIQLFCCTTKRAQPLKSSSTFAEIVMSRTMVPTMPISWSNVPLFLRKICRKRNFQGPSGVPGSSFWYMVVKIFYLKWYKNTSGYYMALCKEKSCSSHFLFPMFLFPYV